MKVLKEDLCESCRLIRPFTGSDMSIAEFLDESAPKMKNPVTIYSINESLLLFLEKDGGCSQCINFVNKAMQSGWT